MTLLTLPETSGSGRSERAKALVFEDIRSRELLEQIRAVAATDSPVLLLGEVGTGRELVARYIHELSLRRRAPFLSVDCASFGALELDAELFGHERDAVAGLVGSRSGVLENAEGGTLLIEAIGDAPPAVQAKLVRVLEEQQFRKLGARRYAPLDLRFVITSSVQLQEAVRAGHFRADLLRLISGNQLELLPLRKRPGDILPLARHFVKLYQQRIGIGSRSLSPDAERALLEHSFPGNIRELETAIHHALLRCRGRFIEAEDLRLKEATAGAGGLEPPLERLERALAGLFEQSPPHLHALIDQAVLRSAYRFCRQNQLQTARLLGISRNVVRARLIQYGEVAGVLRNAPERPALTSSAARRRGNGRTQQLVRFGYQPFGLLKLLRAQGVLERELQARGYRVEWLHFPSGIRLVDAFRRGRLSLGIVGEGPPIFAHASEIPIVYVAAEAPAPEGEAIVVHRDSPIRSVGALRGKRVALVRGSNAHYLLIRALEEARVPYGEVTLKFVFQEAARARFQHREVDAWAIGDPTLAELERDLPIRVLRDGRGLTANPAYYVASADFVRNHAQAIALFRRELAALQRWTAEHLDEAAAALAEQLGSAREAASATLKRSLGQRLDREEIITSQQRVADAFYRLKLIPRQISVAEATWPLE